MGLRQGKVSQDSPEALQSYLRCRYEPWSYRSLVGSTEMGHVVYSCKLSLWARRMHAVCGYGGTVDYENMEEGFTGNVCGLWADVTDGRYLKSEMRNNMEVVITEDRTRQVHRVRIPPCFTSGKVRWIVPGSQRVRLQENHIVMVIGCHEHIAVVQVLSKKDCFIPEFYIIDLKDERCLGKIANIEVSELMWYEAYISPDCSQALLRPLYSLYITNNVASNDVFTEVVGGIQIIAMSCFPDAGGFALAFDNRFDNGFIFRGKSHSVELYDLSQMEVTQSSGELALPAPIKQLKSSPSGSYLALRCVYPNFSARFELNTVVVMAAKTLQILFTIGAGDAGSAMQSTRSMRVFPCFSACDSTMAISRKEESSEYVHVYKLPSVAASLQHCCRKVIRSSCCSSDVDKLRLPTRLIEYLKYQHR